MDHVHGGCIGEREELHWARIPVGPNTVPEENDVYSQLFRSQIPKEQADVPEAIKDNLVAVFDTGTATGECI